MKMMNITTSDDNTTFEQQAEDTFSRPCAFVNQSKDPEHLYSVEQLDYLDPDYLEEDLEEF